MGKGSGPRSVQLCGEAMGASKGKPPVDGQHVCLADAERSSSQPKTNEYWGYAWLFLALITNYIRLYSWKWVKILLRPFWSHFTYPQSRILSPFRDIAVGNIDLENFRTVIVKFTFSPSCSSVQCFHKELSSCSFFRPSWCSSPRK